MTVVRQVDSIRGIRNAVYASKNTYLINSYSSVGFSHAYQGYHHHQCTVYLSDCITVAMVLIG